MASDIIVLINRIKKKFDIIIKEWKYEFYRFGKNKIR